jgi:hypothetical protein
MGTGVSGIVGIGAVFCLNRSGLMPRWEPCWDLIRAIATFSWSFRDRVFDRDMPSIRAEASLLPCSEALLYHSLASFKSTGTYMPIS